MGLTVSSKTIVWSAAAEKTRSKLYVLLLSAFGPSFSSTFLPFAPSAWTTTALFSLTSRSLRPLHRTTTLMLVSWPGVSKSYSRSLRFVALVATEATDSAGEAGRWVWEGPCWYRKFEVRVPGRTLERAAAPVRRFDEAVLVSSRLELMIWVLVFLFFEWWMVDVVG